MNPEAKEYLEKILNKTPESLNEHEIRFLKARSGYLKKAQLEEFESVLKVKLPEPEKEPEVLDDKMTIAYRKEANELGIIFNEETTKEELIELIKNKKKEK